MKEKLLLNGEWKMRNGFKFDFVKFKGDIPKDVWHENWSRVISIVDYLET